MIPVRGFEGKQVAVFGLGRTGLTAARALVAGGAEVALWDEKPASRDAAAAEGFAVVNLETADWSQFAALMLSPGVPLTHPRPHWTVTRSDSNDAKVIAQNCLQRKTLPRIRLPFASVKTRPRVLRWRGVNA